MLGSNILLPSAAVSDKQPSKDSVLPCVSWSVLAGDIPDPLATVVGELQSNLVAVSCCRHPRNAVSLKIQLLCSLVVA